MMTSRRRELIGDSTLCALPQGQAELAECATLGFRRCFGHRLFHSLAYVGDEFESPVTWHCRGCEAAVSPEGRVEHTQYCAVGRAEQHIAADVSYGPPAGDAGQEEFFAG